MSDAICKITCNTKPIVDALGLGIIAANVSKHYRLSTMLQITGMKNLLIFNTAAANILSEMKVRGMSEGIGDEPVIALVDADKFKTLLSTLEANTVEFDFVEGGVIVHSGSSKFVFPAYVESDGYTIPSLDPVDVDAVKIDIDISNWKFIQDSQMYALAASYIHPVYNNVWIGEDGSVLSGDFDISLFTCSKKGTDLNESCLLPATIVNLLSSIPEGGKLVKMKKGYQIQVITDAFEYTSQFTPKHETDPDVGSYHSDIILSQFKGDNPVLEVSLPAIQKTLNQANIVSDMESNSKIDMKHENGTLTISNAEINSKISVKSDTNLDWSGSFYFKQIVKAIAHHKEDTLKIMPIINEDSDSVDGLLLYDIDLQTIVAGVE